MRDRALITGASSGIGEAFAERLAQDGYDLIVTARRAERLETLSDRLSKQFGVGVEAIPADLSEDGDRRALEERIRSDEELSLLVNNAGFGGYRPFVDLDPDVAEDLIGVHVIATARLTRAVLPGMIARRAGGIINIASLLAFSGTLPAPPLPNRVTYAAAKSFMVAFTQLLASELDGTGVRVSVCCPGLVATEFHEVQGMDTSAMPPRMSAADLVTAALAGLQRGEVVCVPSLEDEAAIERLGQAQQTLLSSSIDRSRPPKIASRYRT